MLRPRLCMTLASVLLTAAAAAAQDGAERQTRLRGVAAPLAQRGKTWDAREPKAGDAAPPLKLRLLNERSREIDLTGFFGTKPVVLFFGSYT